jgi:hypothetical protein
MKHTIKAPSRHEAYRAVRKPMPRPSVPIKPKKVYSRRDSKLAVKQDFV